MMAQFKRSAFSWALAVLLPIFALYPALTSRIEEHAYDAAMFHVYRGVVFSAARADGWLYPRWVQSINAGLGGPLFSFYSPLVYWLMDGLYRLGLPHPLAWRVLVALALCLASTGAFGLALGLFRRADAALVSAVAWAYAPGLLGELFERGSPQGLAMAAYPWLLWALLALVERPSGLHLAMASACWAAIILLHNVAALLLLPVLALFIAFLLVRSSRTNAGADGQRKGCGPHGARRALLLSAAALFLGLLLAAFYVVPFVSERKYVQLANASKVDYTQPAANPLPLRELLNLPPVLDIGLGNNGLGPAVGLLHGFVLLAGPVAAAIGWRRRSTSRQAGEERPPERPFWILVGGLAAWALVTIWLQMAQATPVWLALPALGILQFRWRLLATLGLSAALLWGYLVAVWPSRWRRALLVPLVATLIGSQLPSLYPELLPRWNRFPPSPTVADAQAFALRANLPSLTTFGELLPRWRTMALTAEEAQNAAASPLANLPEGARLTASDRRTGRWRLQIETPVAFEAAFHLLYFPGWAGYVDGQRQPLRPLVGLGYTLLALPAGLHTIDLRYEGTFPQRLGDLASSVAAASLLLLALLWRSRGGNGPCTPQTRRPKDQIPWRFGSEYQDPHVYLQPRWWLAVGLLVLAGFKAGWIDPHTTWLRWASTCDAPHGAQVRADAWFSDDIHLCGYTLPRSQVHPGDTLAITLYWQARQPVGKFAQSFVHLLGTSTNPETGNPLWGQVDRQAPGGHPVTGWVPGKLYRDVYEIHIPPHTPPGEYQIEIGWWRPADGQRLKPELAHREGKLALSPFDSLLIPGITVR